LDELSLRLIDKDMEIERAQEARETERAERERERVQWQTREKEMAEVENALALVKDERLTILHAMINCSDFAYALRWTNYFLYICDFVLGFLPHQSC
jgi:hypothetical protein